jgi:hypothetical protein
MRSAGMRTPLQVGSKTLHITSSPDGARILELPVGFFFPGSVSLLCWLLC